MTVRLRCRRPDKVKHPTEAAAHQTILRLMGKAGEERMDAYRCGDHWHIANKLPETGSEAV